MCSPNVSGKHLFHTTSSGYVQFHKRQEVDLLDLKKKTEETVLLEMVGQSPEYDTTLELGRHGFNVIPLCCQEQLEQDGDGKVTSEKHTERKREPNLHSLRRFLDLGFG